jgi:Lrp/AsnC family leucine-responsive transcriptional regulator
VVTRTRLNIIAVTNIIGFLNNHTGPCLSVDLVYTPLTIGLSIYDCKFTRGPCIAGVKLIDMPSYVITMELDNVDIRILELLQSDGRLSFNDVAKEVGVTTPTVSHRISTLMDLNLIRGFQVDLDTDLLNEITTVMTIDCKPSDVPKLLERFDSFREVRELFVIDGTRLFAKVTTTDREHLNEFLGRLTQVEEIISYRYGSVTRTVKERPRALIHTGLKLTVDCYYCGKPVVENPVKIKLDGKDHYLCCGSCETLYRDKYGRLKEASDLDSECVTEEHEGGHHGHHGH